MERPEIIAGLQRFDAPADSLRSNVAGPPKLPLVHAPPKLARTWTIRTSYRAAVRLIVFVVRSFVGRSDATVDAAKGNCSVARQKNVFTDAAQAGP